MRDSIGDSIGGTQDAPIPRVSGSHGDGVQQAETGRQHVGAAPVVLRGHAAAGACGAVRCGAAWMGVRWGVMWGYT